MPKIVYVPLDERPCNLIFPTEIFAQEDIEIVVPSGIALPTIHTPANFEALQAFLTTETQNAAGLVLSMDTLLYGGLVPSRIHMLPKDVIVERLGFLDELKRSNPALQIFGFQVIMRCPQGNDTRMEPPYYRTYGSQIFKNGIFTQKRRLGILSESEQETADTLAIPEEVLKDYLHRRDLNLSLNIASLDSVKNQTLDFLVMCQDDADEYGYPAMDQEVIQAKIKESRLMFKVLAYSGADELGMVLVARMMNHLKQKTPRVFVRYPSPTAPMVVPCLEDRYLDNSIKYQILASGGMQTTSLADADLVLIPLIGGTKMFPYPVANHRDIDVLANLVEAIAFAQWASATHPIVIADLLFLNAGSLEVMRLLEAAQMTMKLAAYAGWNTASNTLGTAIGQAMAYYHFGKTKKHIAFLLKRYIEDIGYCGVVRDLLTNAGKMHGYDYFDTHEVNGVASKLAKQHLEAFIQSELATCQDQFVLENVNLPWKRLFEVDFTITVKE